MAFNERETLMANITAIDIAFRVRKENRTATPLEKKQMKEYKGFGGCRSILLDPDNPKQWNKSREKNREAVKLLHETILSHAPEQKEEIMRKLQASTATAFYTPENFIKALGKSIHKALGHLPEKILEPSAGNGRFLEVFNGIEGAEHIKKTAYEKDYLTGIILDAINDDTNVHIDGFETMPADENGTYDLAISNIPFGNIKVYDPSMSKSKDPARKQATTALHNYFFIKGLDAVRNGGLVVFITSRGVAESDGNKSIREYLVNHSNLVSGIRLPDNLFEEEGISEVGTDLLIFQRNDNKQELTEQEKLFVETQDLQYTEVGRDEKENQIDLSKTHARNLYFNEDVDKNYLWNIESLDKKHSLGLCTGNDRDQYGNLCVNWAMDSDYWEMGMEEELEHHILRDFKNNYDRKLTMQGTEKREDSIYADKIKDILEKFSDITPHLNYTNYLVKLAKELETALQDNLTPAWQDKESERTRLGGLVRRMLTDNNYMPYHSKRYEILQEVSQNILEVMRTEGAAEEEIKVKTEYPKYVPQPGEYTLHLKEGALVMQNGIPGFIKEEFIEGEKILCFVQRNETVANEKEYAKAYIELRNSYYELKDTEERTQTEQPELRKKLNETFPKYFEMYDMYRGWDNNGRAVSTSVDNDLNEFLSEVSDLWTWPKNKTDKYDLGEIFRNPVNIKQDTTNSPAMNQIAEEVMSLYDLLGMSEEERTQIKSGKRRKAASSSTRKNQPKMDDLFNGSLFQKEEPVRNLSPRLFAMTTDHPYYKVFQSHYEAGTMVYYDELAGHLRKGEGSNLWFYPMEENQQILHGELVKAYTDIKNAYWKLFDTEKESEEEQPELRQILNDAYDKAVERFGGLREEQFAEVVSLDMDYSSIAALESYENGQRIKADIFEKPVSFKVEEDKEWTPEEALSHSLNIYGSVNMPEMSRRTGMKEEELVEHLKEKLYYNPVEDVYEEQTRMLSGDIYEKIEMFQNELEWRKSEYSNRENDRIIQEINRTLDALEHIKPPKIAFEELDLNLGERWIPMEYYMDFAKEVFDINQKWSLDNLKIKYHDFQDTWEVNISASWEKNKEWEVDNLKAEDIFRYALENRTPDLKKKAFKDGQGWVDVPDVEANMAVLAKMELLQEKFEEFMFNLPVEKKQELEKTYNTLFNNSVRPHYDGSCQTFPGLSFEQFDYNELYQSQKDAIWMIKQNGGGICDHQVGAGKTMIMCVAAHELKRLGLAHKPMIIALKANVQEIAATYQKAYPNARILYPGAADFKPENRNELFRKIQNNNYDCVIMSHEQFAAIPQSLETQKEIMEDELNSVRECLATWEKTWGRSASGRQYNGLVKRQENLEVKLKELMDQIKNRYDDTVDFATMGIDHIFVDESHQFKNLRFETRHTRVAGLGNNAGSQRSMNLYTAIREIQKKTGKDLGATFLSGTTISNSLTELYALFKYLRPKALAKQNIKCFDAWAAVYTRKTSEFEFSVTNEVVQKERFRYFIKVPELSQFYSQITDFRTADMIGLDRPQKNEIFRSIAPSKDQEEFTKRLVNYAKNGDPTTVGLANDQRQSKAKMLIATNLSNKMSLDMRLIDEFEYQHTSGGKVDVAADTIAEYYRKFNDSKGTQFVFSDLGTYKPGEWNVYSAIKDRLVEVHGIPENEIAFIQENKTDKKKTTLIKKMNDGDIRVVFGSTQMLGTGINAQQRAVAVHHLDTPWRPSDLEQREGRAVRKGNVVARMEADNKVDVITYATERSLDAYKFNLLQNKQNFINQLKNNQIGVRRLDEGGMDETTGVPFAEYVALLSGNTDLLEKAKLDKKINMLEKERNIYRKETAGLSYSLKLHKDNLNDKINTRNILKEEAERTGKMPEVVFKGKDNVIRFGADVGKYINTFKKEMPPGTQIIGYYADMPVVMDKTPFLTGKGYHTEVYLFSNTKEQFPIRNQKESFPAAYSEGEKWLNNVVADIPKRVDRLQSIIDDIKQEIANLDNIIQNRKWPKEDLLKELKQEDKELQHRINSQMKQSSQEQIEEDVSEISNQKDDLPSLKAFSEQMEKEKEEEQTVRSAMRR